MKTLVKIEVTAYFASKEANFEKSASADVEISDSATPDWAVITSAIVRQAMTVEDGFPFKHKPMTKRQIAAYREAEDIDDAIAAAGTT